MIILPPRYQPKLFMPVPKAQWREPSRATPKDEFGNPDQTRFRVRARQRLDDGFLRTVWVGWFDSRDDFDAFSWSLARHLALGEPMPRQDWDLPSPSWVPGMGELLEYDFATQVFLTTTTGSNQTYTSPSDWNNSSNTVELIGAGASGACISSSGGGHATGGGGGEYGLTSNFSFATPGTTTATYQLGTGGTGVSKTTSTGNGNSGGATWFNGTTQAGATLGGKGGTNGVQGSGSQNGGAGGTGGVGTTHLAGGRGGNLTGASGNGASGGGGAGGNTAAGSNGSSSSSTSLTSTSGGAGDGGSGGSAGTSGGGAGGNGAEWDASHGSGGGGGGDAAFSGSRNGGAGGLYGAGGGAACLANNGTASTSGAGKQGIIALTYTPLSAISMNAPMLGM